MPSCILKDCTNRTSCKSSKQEAIEEGRKLSFHRVPKNIIRRRSWLENLGIHESDVPNDAVVCSMHFVTGDYDRTCPSRIRLKSHAIPYVLKQELNTDSDLSAEPLKEMQRCESSSNSECLVLKEEFHNDSDLFAEPLKKIRRCESASNSECTYTNDKGMQVTMSCNDKATCVSPTMHFNSPRKQELRRHAARMKKKFQNELKLLKQKYKRSAKKVETLQTMLQTLRKKKLLEGEHIETLENISSFNKQLFQLMRRKSAKLPIKRQYSAEIRLFSLTLHYYSPRAYSYVREKFNLCIPHPKTLYKWYRSIDGEPGFNDEAIRHLTAYSASIDTNVYATLVIDEMSIRQQIEFDGKRFCGVVNVGREFACNSNNTAKDALVFLLVGLNQTWKIPVGYFLIDRISGEQKSNLVQQCLRLVHDTGVRVVCVTCDGAANNIAMIKILGCNFSDVNCLQTYFRHPITMEHVYFMPDPCHMVKLIRNTLGDFKCLKNSLNKRIKWVYIVALHNLQDKEGLHLGNKLSKRHIEYEKKKMKVKYATQIFSASVGNALNICRTDLRLPQFRHSYATEECLLLINDLFDILNSKNLRQQNYKRPISVENYDSIKTKLLECKNYLLNITYDDGRKVVESNRKVGFLGLVICIESTIQLYENLCATDCIQHIPMYRFSQDHIELFFGCIRSFGRSNNNPTARQFKSAFKRLLLRNEVKSVQTGNCIPLHNIPILYYSSATPVDVINSSTQGVTLSEDFQTYEEQLQELEKTDQINEYHNYILPNEEDFTAYTEFKDRIVVYISGWIVRKLSKCIRCLECVNSLYDTTHPKRIHNLINVKNRGSLIYPAHDVIAISRACEKVIQISHIKDNLGNLALMQNSVFRMLNVHNLCKDLVNHSNDQTPLMNHRIHLIKCIINEYIKVRIHHICKQKDTTAQNKRTFYNKLILFSGH